MKNEIVDDVLTSMMVIKDGVVTPVEVDGEHHMDIIIYPPQENYAMGATLVLLKKPFIDFALACGDAGAMTVDMIMDKYGEYIDPIMANTIAVDFSKAYGNYKIIPDGMTLAIVGPSVKNVFDLMAFEKKETPNSAEEE